MSAPVLFPATRPVLERALDWAERATRSMLRRLAYAQHTAVDRVAVIADDGPADALEVAGRYLLWATAPRPARFARQREPALDDVRWRLALRGSGGALPALVELGRYDDLAGGLKALVRELLADRFLPMRHRRAGGRGDQASASPRQVWR